MSDYSDSFFERRNAERVNIEEVGKTGKKTVKMM
jgi:hypothetical protein